MLERSDVTVRSDDVRIFDAARGSFDVTASLCPLQHGFPCGL